MRSRFHRWRRPRLRGGRHGVKLGMSDTHTVINADSATALDISWQSCRVDVVRNALSRAGTTGRRAVSAFIATSFARSDAQDIPAQWREVADNSTPSCQRSPPERKTGVVARIIFPTRHRISHARPVRSRGSTSRPSCGQRVVRFGCATSGGLARRAVGGLDITGFVQVAARW
jgi:transposase-like protein